MFERLRRLAGRVLVGLEGTRARGHAGTQERSAAIAGSSGKSLPYGAQGSGNAPASCPPALVPSCPPKTARTTGDHAETTALAHLRAAGLTLIARNFLARGGELDLVMREGNVLVFVEVRFRADGGHGDGLDSVSATKQRRLTAAARQFLSDHSKYARWTTRFDAVALGAGGLRWVKNVIAVDEAGW